LSIDAISWAFKQEIKPSSLKFVLVALADNATADGMAWPSIKALCEKTSQDRKTVIASLDKLEEMGIISDSGKRTGATGQVKVYRFNSTENGTVPKTEQYRISHETVPFFRGNSTENGTRNLKGTIKEPTSNTDVLLVADSDPPKCPHQEIINLYHRILPACPRIRDWTATRAKALKARWCENKEHQSLAYWEALFRYIARCPFLVGKSGARPFFASLDWICKAENFAKIREGRYEEVA
jgi:hypothetical protein